jgi:FkbM family methyltransferase
MNYLLDCGTHFFQGLNKLNDIYRFDHTWQIYCFEANPITFIKSKKYYPSFPNIIHENLAVSINENECIVNCDINNNDECGQGSNILTSPPNKDIVYNHLFNFMPYKVKKFDICKFLQQLNNIEQLIIKIDIEGEEFNVVPHILKHFNCSLINTIYIEFHERFFIEEIETYQKLKIKYKESLSKLGCRVIEWE